MSSKLPIFCRKAGIPSSGSTHKDAAGPEAVRANLVETGWAVHPNSTRDRQEVHGSFSNNRPRGDYRCTQIRTCYQR
jgi:hypothetical protein